MALIAALMFLVVYLKWAMWMLVAETFAFGAGFAFGY